MPNDDREQRFDHALARHLPNASPDSSCPDAEILAAYHDRTLSTDEMSHWKEHMTACNRCQETLALVEQTEHLPAAEWEHQNSLPAEQPASPAVFRAAAAHAVETAQPSHPSSISAEIHDEMNSLRRRPSWRLLVALGAIAATVIVWIGAREVRMQHRKQAYEAQEAQNRLTMPPLPAPQTEPRSSVKKEALTVPKQSQEIPAQKKTDSASPTPAQQRNSERLASAAPAIPADNSAITEQKDALGGTTRALGATRHSSPASGSFAGTRPAAPATSPNAAGSAGARANESAATKQQADTAARVAAESLEDQTPPVNATSAQMEVSAPPAGNLLQRAAASHRYVVAPGEAHGWILGTAGQVMHTTDRGKTWKPQTTGVIADLTAGSATSDKICWVVGRAGTLLLTTDGGQHWKLLPSPIAGDLGGVHATDATHASIWDVPNRTSYQTSDGGVTWQRTANE